MIFSRGCLRFDPQTFSPLSFCVCCIFKLIAPPALWNSLRSMGTNAQHQVRHSSFTYVPPTSMNVGIYIGEGASYPFPISFSKVSFGLLYTVHVTLQALEKMSFCLSSNFSKLLEGENHAINRNFTGKKNCYEKLCVSTWWPDEFCKFRLSNYLSISAFKLSFISAS